MNLTGRLAATLGAVSLAVQPTLAAAQEQACITEEEVSALVIYFAPAAIESVQQSCATALAANGYLAQRGEALAARYAALQDAAWPSAKSGFMKFSSKKNAGVDDFATLPDDAVRPLVDAIITQQVSAQIGTKDCDKIERVLEAMDPFEPSAVAKLVAVIAGLVGKENPRVCPVRRT